MAVTLQWEPRGVVRTFSGVVAFDEFLESIAELQNDMRFDSIRYVIEDFSAIETLRVTAEDIDTVIASAIGAAFSNPNIRVAAIPHSDTTRALIREFAKGSPFVTRMFESVAAARAWIGGGDTTPVPLEVQLQATVNFDS